MNSLKKIRERAGFTKAQSLAEAAGISPGHLSNLESGKSDFSNEILEKLCKVLQTTGEAILAPSSPSAGTKEPANTPQMQARLAKTQDDIDWPAILGPMPEPPTRKDLRVFHLRLIIAQSAINMYRVTEEKDREAMSNDIIETALELRNVLAGKTLDAIGKQAPAGSAASSPKVGFQQRHYASRLPRSDGDVGRAMAQLDQIKGAK
jgi:transcriptional regulator with XRE-family HTH domain